MQPRDRVEMVQAAQAAASGREKTCRSTRYTSDSREAGLIPGTQAASGREKIYRVEMTRANRAPASGREKLGLNPRILQVVASGREKICRSTKFNSDRAVEMTQAPRAPASGNDNPTDPDFGRGKREAQVAAAKKRKGKGHPNLELQNL